MKKLIMLVVAIIISVMAVFLVIFAVFGNEEEETVISNSNFYTIDLPIQGAEKKNKEAESVDINGDGIKDAVRCEVTKNGGVQQYRFQFNEYLIELERDLASEISAMAVHSSAGNFIVLSEDYPYADSIYLYDADKDFELIQTIEGARISSLSDGEAVLEYRVDVLATWRPKETVKYDKSGFKITDTAFILNNDPAKSDDAQGLTLISSLEYVDSEGKDTQLEEGEVIYPLKIDGNVIEFVSNSGLTGHFTFETVDFQHQMVNGMDETELFKERLYTI